LECFEQGLAGRMVHDRDQVYQAFVDLVFNVRCRFQAADSISDVDHVPDKRAARKGKCFD